MYFHAWLMLDIFGRYVVGWLLIERESAELADQLIAATVRWHHKTRHAHVACRSRRQRMHRHSGMGFVTPHQIHYCYPRAIRIIVKPPPRRCTPRISEAPLGQDLKPPALPIAARIDPPQQESTNLQRGNLHSEFMKPGEAKSFPQPSEVRRVAAPGLPACVARSQCPGTSPALDPSDAVPFATPLLPPPDLSLRRC